MVEKAKYEMLRRGGYEMDDDDKQEVVNEWMDLKDKQVEQEMLKESKRRSSRLKGDRLKTWLKEKEVLARRSIFQERQSRTLEDDDQKKQEKTKKRDDRMEFIKQTVSRTRRKRIAGTSRDETRSTRSSRDENASPGTSRNQN